MNFLLLGSLRPSIASMILIIIQMLTNLEIYGMPITSVEIFYNRIADILNITEKEQQKICYFMDDLNIDLFKIEEHLQMSNYLDTISFSSDYQPHQSNR